MDVDKNGEQQWSKIDKRSKGLRESQLIFAELTVEKGTAPLKGLIDKIKGVLLGLADAVVDKKVAILPLDRNNKSDLKAITSPSMVPNKHAKLRKYAQVLNDTKELTTPIKGQHGRVFSVILRIGFNADLESAITDCEVDLAASGVRVEIKRHPAIHSKKNILLPFAPRQASLSYVENICNTTLTQAIHRSADASSLSGVRKSLIKQDNYFVLLSCSYPRTTFRSMSKARGRMSTQTTRGCGRWNMTPPMKISSWMPSLSGKPSSVDSSGA